ncbi:MAG TPA: ABC transporter permease [Burkholderiaceae bacterium]
MNFMQIVIEALRSLSANRLRTALTMLGIVIGIASVVMMLAVGDAVRLFVDKQLAQLGSNLMIVQPGSVRTAGGIRRRTGEAPTLTIDDAIALNKLPSIAGAAAAMQGFFQINYGGDNSNSTVLGITPDMLHVRNWTVERGVGISDDDVRAGQRVIVIGSQIADRYFYKLDPLGQQVRVDGTPFTVIGVLAGSGRMFDGVDLGELLLVPVTAMPIKMQLPRTVHYAIVQAKEGVPMRDAEEDIKDLLRDRHHITGDKTDDFQITNLASIAATGETIATALSIGLGAIGAISLMVGGIGIMNIMLVSVSERVREIGIRMAIGAKPRHILMQFLSEAVMMCVLGGLIGTALAGVGAWVVNQQSDKFSMTLSASHILTAVVFSTAVGLFFGFYPARRASKLLPIECLRQD